MSRREFRTHADAALEAYRQAAQAEADEQFDDRALNAQRARILERIAKLGHQARVIRFPAGTTAQPSPAGISRRWISAAAAAGLVVGLVSGQFVRILRPSTIRAGTPAARPAQARTVIVPSAIAAQDDGLLSLIDSAVQLRTAAELRVLDELTPFHEPR